MFIDTHSHLNFPDFNEDYRDVIERAKSVGITAILNVGANLPTSKRAIDLAQKENLCYATVGVHPTNTNDLKTEDYLALEDLAKRKKVVAIGEIGLDYFHHQVPRKIQKESFKQQILIAERLELPVIIHNRDANQDSLAILGETRMKRGVMHCFSGDSDFAREVLSLGFYISFTGNLTYKRNEFLREVAREIPLERMLLETDCPYLSPQTKRGMRNEPSFLIYAAEELARIKGISLENLGEITTKNAKNLFALESVL